MFSTTPINARKRARPQHHGLPATQPSQPLRPQSWANRNHIAFSAEEDDSLIPRTNGNGNGNGQRSPQRRVNTGELQQRMFKNTPVPPRTRLLDISDDENEDPVEEEDNQDDSDYVVEEGEEEEEEDEQEYSVPILPAHEYEDEEEKDIEAYEEEYNKIQRQQIQRVKQKPVPVYNSDEDEDEDDDSDDEEGGSWVIEPMQRFVGRIFAIAYKTMSRLLGPFFTRRMWWAIPAFFSTLLVSAGVAYIIYYSILGLNGLYKPPMAIPENMDDVVSRLMSVERELTSVSRLSNSLNIGMQDNYRDHHDKFEKLESEFAKVTKGIHKVSNELGRLSNANIEYDEKATVIGSQLETLQSNMKKLQEALSTQIDDQSELFAITNQQNNTIMNHVAAMKRIEGALDGVKTRLVNLEEAEMGEQSALQVIEQYLPKRLAVSIDPDTRQVMISPEFWTYLEQHVINTEQPVQDVNWDEFLKQNDYAIQTIVDDKLGDSLARVVEKSEFETLLEEKMKQQRQAVSIELEKLQRRVDLHGETTQVNTPTQEVLERLVREEIGKHTKGTIIEKPDFADVNQGAKINHRKTSQTFSHTYGKSVFYKLERSVLEGIGFGRPIVHEPETAITEGTSLGYCWPFQGSQGQLAIDLADDCLISDLAVYHVPFKTTLNHQSAPKTVSLWANVDDESQYAAMGFTTKPNYVRLVSGQFNYQQQDTGIQVFHVSVGYQAQRIITNQVIVSVDDNWGNPDYTCLYRIRVFGDQPSRIETETVNSENAPPDSDSATKKFTVQSVDQEEPIGAGFGDDEYVE